MISQDTTARSTYRSDFLIFNDLECRHELPEDKFNVVILDGIKYSHVKVRFKLLLEFGCFWVGVHKLDQCSHVLVLVKARIQSSINGIMSTYQLFKKPIKKTIYLSRQGLSDRNHAQYAYSRTVKLLDVSHGMIRAKICDINRSIVTLKSQKHVNTSSKYCLAYSSSSFSPSVNVTVRIDTVW